jgi:Rps23 Pro-64 3,4-dihydroxylase Tpa1-like proline 4-hydroxylase
MKTTFLKSVDQEINGIFLALLLLTIFTLPYCTDQSKEKTHRSLNEFNAYVKEHKDASENYADQKWEDLEKEYNNKKADLDKNANKMDQEMKASYDNAIADWDSFKNSYLLKQKEKEDQKRADELKAKLVPMGTNIDFSNIDSKNIAAVYDHFVNTVDKNKDFYSKEEWINITNYWKSLNDMETRLDQTHSIPKPDLRKIEGLQIKFVAIKALNKPFAESENK